MKASLNVASHFHSKGCSTVVRSGQFGQAYISRLQIPPPSLNRLLRLAQGRSVHSPAHPSLSLLKSPEILTNLRHVFYTHSSADCRLARDVHRSAAPAQCDSERCTNGMSTLECWGVDPPSFASGASTPSGLVPLGNVSALPWTVAPSGQYHGPHNTPYNE